MLQKINFFQNSIERFFCFSKTYAYGINFICVASQNDMIEDLLSKTIMLFSTALALLVRGKNKQKGILFTGKLLWATAV